MLRRTITIGATHNLLSSRASYAHAVSVVQVDPMLEIAQEIVEKIDPLLDAGDAESAGKLLVHVNQALLRAVLIHVLRERGSEVADAVGSAYLREKEAFVHKVETA
jgi:hypothetical protein